MPRDMIADGGAEMCERNAADGVTWLHVRERRQGHGRAVRCAATPGPRLAFTGGLKLPPHHPRESAIR
jgi:hypothetical protein